MGKWMNSISFVIQICFSCKNFRLLSKVLMFEFGHNVVVSVEEKGHLWFRNSCIFQYQSFQYWLLFKLRTVLFHPLVSVICLVDAASLLYLAFAF